ncbi:hypothetical protein PMAYCL1PPCAC_05282, partial [Pristionchus mayeri]
GETPFEAAWVEAIADKWKDFHNDFQNFLYPKLGLARETWYLSSSQLRLASSTPTLSFSNSRKRSMRFRRSTSGSRRDRR